MDEMKEITYKFVQSLDKAIYDILVKAKENGYTIDDLIRLYENTHHEPI